MLHRVVGRVKQVGMRGYATAPIRLAPSFAELVGNTPLLQLRGASKRTGCRVLGKAEFMNPGGSVKDRAAVALCEAAERDGKVTPGGTLVDGTAGNTGIGLAHVANAKGYKCVIFMPETQSAEKMALLRTLGAEVHPVPAVPLTDPNHYVFQAERYAEERENAVFLAQFDNTANRDAHVATTGPEIWEQTGGEVDAFTCATGTGGTLAGVGKYLKSQDERVKVILADPPGSVLYSWVQSGGERMERGGGSITEGIGQGRITDNLAGTTIDGAVQIPDEDTIRVLYELIQTEGLYLGASSALNVVAAEEVAKQLGPGHTVVTMLCDGAARYAARLFSKSWLQEKQLWDAIPEDCRRLASFD